MNADVAWTDAELQEANEILAEDGATLLELLEKWASAIEDVEKGYWGAVDDFDNDIYQRDLLQKVVDQASSDMAGKVQLVLAPLDARFMAATVDRISYNPLPSVEEDPRRWNYRVPRYVDVGPDEYLRTSWASYGATARE